MQPRRLRSRSQIPFTSGSALIREFSARPPRSLRLRVEHTERKIHRRDAEFAEGPSRRKLKLGRCFASAAVRRLPGDVV